MLSKNWLQYHQHPPALHNLCGDKVVPAFEDPGLLNLLMNLAVVSSHFELLRIINRDPGTL